MQDKENKKTFMVGLLLGTNIGNKINNLRIAIGLLSTTAGKIVKKSSIYRTAAWGKEDQPDFYNQAVLIESPLQPEHLMEQLLIFEKQMGRQRREKWGARIIDIDILFYNDKIIDLPYLKIPHPQLPNRKFALVPLAETDPDWIHPQSGKNIMYLLMACSDPLEVSLVK
jgi:2-amino-4-hydroxy-6-hydroxymethyldihydropteridine diphosphokinase